MRCATLAAAAALLAPVAGAQEAVLASFGPDRAEPCGAGSFSFSDGDVHRGARESLLDPAAFGVGGVVERSIVLAPPLAEIGQTNLIGADIFVLTRARTLSACEQRTLRDFVRQGGGVIAFTNEAGRDLQFITGSGPLGACGGGGFAFVSGHPIVEGPFGPLTGLLGGVFHCRYESLGPVGTPLLETAGAAMGAAFEVQLGRVVVINDEEWAMNAGGCPAAPFWGPTSERLLRNAVAWILPDPGFGFAPSDYVCYPDCALDCQLDFFDFLCFQDAFTTTTPYADCDESGALDFFDFLCFQNAFAAGCP